MNRMRILVTGAGGAVGQGVIKALNISRVPVTIISGDISPLNAALFRTDDGVLIPRVEEDGAVDAFIALIRRKNIDGVMIGSEFDLEFFSRYRSAIESETGAKVVVSPLETVQIANDKWDTAEFLRRNGLPYAKSVLPANLSDAVTRALEWGYPVLLKSRTGTSSRNVHFVFSETDMERVFELTPNPMLQQVISMPGHQLASEYTCSVMKCADGTLVGPFTARRTIHGGHSQIVEVDKFTSLYPVLLEIGKRLEIVGSLNVQLMIGADGPVPFEFNARFSGTTAIRAYFGFNEPEMVLRSFFLGERVEQPEVRTGVSFRYDEQVFVEGVKAEALNEPFPRGHVVPWF